MQVLANILLFIIGAFIGMIFFHAVIVRVFYMLPKSIYMVSKGILKPVSILVILIAPILFMVTLGALGYFFPSIVDYVDTHRFIGIAINLNTIWLCFKYAFTDRGKEKARATFWLSNLSYTTPKWHDHLKHQQEKEKTKLEGLKTIIDDKLKEY